MIHNGIGGSHSNSSYLLSPPYSYMLAYYADRLYEIFSPTNTAVGTMTHENYRGTPVWSILADYNVGGSFNALSNVLLDYSNLNDVTFYKKNGESGVDGILKNINKYGGYTSIYDDVTSKITRDDFSKLVPITTPLRPLSLLSSPGSTLSYKRYYTSYKPPMDDPRYLYNLPLIFKSKKDLVFKVKHEDDIKYLDTDGAFKPLRNIQELNTQMSIKRTLKYENGKTVTVNTIENQNRIYIRIKYNNAVKISNGKIVLNHDNNPLNYISTNPIVIKEGKSRYKGFIIDSRKSGDSWVIKVTSTNYLPDLIVNNKDIEIDNLDFYIEEVIII